MKAPDFWWEPPGSMSDFLTPASWIWSTVTKLRLRYGRWAKLDTPVICVGNLTVGGSGKTPTVAALVERLSDRKPHIVSRGYGGAVKGTVRVEPETHTAEEVGDEPLLHARYAPTWVSPDRLAGARAAEAAGAGLIILDDGFQNPALGKDLSIVVVDAAVGFGNGCVVPAGPLREPVAEGLKRADLLLLIGSDKERADWAMPPGLDLPVIEAEIVPVVNPDYWYERRVAAFAGIGRPEKFFRTLRGLGARVVDFYKLPDHAEYNRQMDLEDRRSFEETYDQFRSRRFAQFLRDAHREGLELVTTENDAARMTPAMRANVVVLPIKLEFQRADALDAALAKLS